MKHTNITNSKNVISDSNIKVGGNFSQGDGKQDNRTTNININIGKIALGGGITISVGALVLYLLFYFPQNRSIISNNTVNNQEDTTRVSEKPVNTVSSTSSKDFKKEAATTSLIISGYVKDTEGHSLAQVAVNVNGVVLHTSESGYFKYDTFDHKEFETGQAIKVLFELAGHKAADEYMYINSTLDKTIFLSKISSE